MSKTSVFGEKVEIMLGDIITFEGDAIVNPVNTELILGGGVSGAVIKAGGTKIQEECEKYGSIALGEVVTTGAGNLKLKYILHAATLSLGTWATQNSVKKALHNALEIAEKLKLKTIAIPALGAGNGALPFSKVVLIFYEELKQYLSKEHVSLEKIYIFLYDKYFYDTFIAMLEDLQNGTREKLVK